MRCENKPLLRDDPGFLQEITSIAVEVGLVRRYVRQHLFSCCIGAWPTHQLVLVQKCQAFGCRTAKSTGLRAHNL